MKAPIIDDHLAEAIRLRLLTEPEPHVYDNTPNVGGFPIAETAPTFFTRQQIAKACHVHDGTVARWIRCGWLHAFRPGTRWLIGADEFRRFLTTRRRN